jgi:NAD(P)-dependent dehydrogenase (short-subunit alcohol dehydrogenase family)
MGAACARELSRRGYGLALLARSADVVALGALAVRGSVASAEDLRRLTDEDWHAGLDLLLLNVVRMARLATPTMLKQGAGAYAKLFSQRYAGSGLRMNNVLPGYIDTHPVDEGARAAIPAGRPGTAEEVARAVAFLASAEASYITGQSLLVDGGLVRAV